MHLTFPFWCTLLLGWTALEDPDYAVLVRRYTLNNTTNFLSDIVSQAFLCFNRYTLADENLLLGRPNWLTTDLTTTRWRKMSPYAVLKEAMKIWIVQSVELSNDIICIEILEHYIVFDIQRFISFLVQEWFLNNWYFLRLWWSISFDNHVTFWTLYLVLSWITKLPL